MNALTYTDLRLVFDERDLVTSTKLSRFMRVKEVTRTEMKLNIINSYGYSTREYTVSLTGGFKEGKPDDLIIVLKNPPDTMLTPDQIKLALVTAKINEYLTEFHIEQLIHFYENSNRRKT